MNFDQQLSKYFSKLGRKSAMVRMKKISAQQRIEIARNAAKARWARRKRGFKSRRGRQKSVVAMRE